jgi:hypothetical protein
MKNNPRYLAFAALAAGPLLSMSPLLGGSSALAAACATASVGVYEAAGFSCSVGPMTFSDITVFPTASGSGVVTLSDFSSFTTVVDGVTEFGLHLFYSSDTGTTPGSQADVGWSYDVSGVPSLTDAFDFCRDDNRHRHRRLVRGVKQWGFSKSERARLNLCYIQRHWVVERYQGSE